MASILVLGLSSAPRSADNIGLHAGSTRERIPGSELGQVYSLLDYFESGRQAVQVYLANAPRKITEPRLGRTIDKAALLCVRVEVRFGEAEAGYQSVNGSGVLIDGGRRVLTAGHTLEALLRHEVIVTLPSGEMRRARAIQQDYEPLGAAGTDWAVLEIVGSGFRGIPRVEFGQADAGELAIILGYPDQIGVNAHGKVVFPTGEDGEELHPLTTLGTISHEDEIILTPRAGSIPTGGMSGGPVFDVHGRLLGIFVSIVRSDNHGEVAYSFRATPVSSVRRFLNY